LKTSTKEFYGHQHPNLSWFGFFCTAVDLQRFPIGLLRCIRAIGIVVSSCGPYQVLETTVCDKHHTFQMDASGQMEISGLILFIDFEEFLILRRAFLNQQRFHSCGTNAFSCVDY